MNKKIILESTRRLVESPAYHGRVQQVADEVMKSSGEIAADELNDTIRHKAQLIKLPELGLGKNSDAFKDFVKDVKVELKQAGFKTKRKPSKAGMSKEQRKEKLQDVLQIMYNEIGSSFPDGDPWDHIIPELKRIGINEDDAIKWMDRAAKLDGYKDYDDLVRQFWDDAISSGDWDNMENPW